MSRDLKRRLDKLEGRGESCTVCGWGPHMAFEVADETDDREPEKPEYCLACGRPDSIVVTWPDQEEEGEGHSY